MFGLITLSAHLQIHNGHLPLTLAFPRCLFTSEDQPSSSISSWPNFLAWFISHIIGYGCSGGKDHSWAVLIKWAFNSPWVKQRNNSNKAEKSLALEGGDAERLPLCHRRDSWKGNLSFYSVHREMISKEAKAVPVTSIVPSLEILLYPGVFLASPVMSLVL